MPFLFRALTVTMALDASAATAQVPSDPSQSAKSEAASAGVIKVPPLDLPVSRYMSPEARATLDLLARYPKLPSFQNVEEAREFHDKIMLPALKRLQSIYNVKIADKSINGIHVREVEPAEGTWSANRDVVLINLHGGGFVKGADVEALVESIPVVGETGMRVITVDYREAPEYKYPAATEDALTVYRQILKTTRASNIGIFGSSAGGSLTAMVVAAIVKNGLPIPAAIGLFSSAAFADFAADPQSKGTWGGDSRYWAPATVGQSPLPIQEADQPRIQFSRDYLSGTNVGDPMASPAESPEIISKFPPTLILTGTRSYDLSAAIETHRRLVRNGVDAELHVWDGLWHCFFFRPDMPESREAYTIMGKFFSKYVGKR
jgi:monoterpene epsilon-lactone hydrolase